MTWLASGRLVEILMAQGQTGEGRGGGAADDRR